MIISEENHKKFLEGYGAHHDKLVQMVAKAGDDAPEMLHDLLSNFKDKSGIADHAREMYNDVAVDNGWHPDDDFEDIEERLLDDLMAEAGLGETRVAENKYEHEYTGLLHPSVDETREDDELNFCYDCKLVSNTLGEIETKNDENDVVCPRCGSQAYVEASDEEIAKYATKNEAKYQGKNVELSKPKRGGSKKFYVYVRDPKTKNVKKVAFGAKSGGGNLAVKLRDPKARKAFADRHNCEQKKDKTKAGYWACRLPRYAKSLGLSGGGTWW
jgi:hypothetical protein